MKIQIVLFDGFDELDAIAPFEVFKQAIAVGADIQVELVTLDNVEEVTAAHGLRIRPNGQLKAEEHRDVLLVPGGNWRTRAPRGAWAQVQIGTLPKAIAEIHQSGTLVAGVCTGSLIMGACGMLQGRPAITHHSAVEDLRTAGAKVVQARVVDDGDIVTAGGVTSGLDLALWLVERFSSTEIALKVEAAMQYERRGIVWRCAP